MSGPPCQAVWSADVVFAGTVRSIEQFEAINRDGEQRPYEVVRFDVDRPFINSVAGPIELVSEPLNTCNYRFRVGGSYLVYAWKDQSARLSASVCSRTRTLAEAGDDIRFLTSMSRLGTGGRVYGRVNELVRDPAEEQWVDNGPVASLRVNVRGSTFSRDVVTDRNGRYELSGVPVGDVSISLQTRFGFEPRTAEGKISDLRGCVEANFTIAAQASATGRVVDEAGRPLAGVMVDAVAAELAGYQPLPFQEPVKTNDQGLFTFERLPPGEYVFGVNLTKGRWKPTTGQAMFLPGTPVAKEATIVELKPGDHKDVGALRLSAR
jgi:hypothetical protein